VKNAIHETVYATIKETTQKLSKGNIALLNDVEIKRTDHMINFLTILDMMLRPSGHRNNPFNKHTTSIQLIKFELFVALNIRNGVRSVNTHILDNYRIPRFISDIIINQNSVIRGEINGVIDEKRGRDMRRILLDEGIPNNLLTRINYILGNTRSTYELSDINIENISTGNITFMDIVNYVLVSYNSLVSNAVSRMEIRSSREAGIIEGLTIMTPVEESAMISATTSGDILALYEVDPYVELNTDDVDNIITTLSLTHSSRWLVNGYTSTRDINKLLTSVGCFGNTELRRRKVSSSPIRSKVQESDFELTISSCSDPDVCVNNYLKINSLPGGMAVMCKSNDKYYLFGITPKGTITINTVSTDVPEYHGNAYFDVVIYNVRNMVANLIQLSRTLNATPRSILTFGEAASVALTQAYQRQIGARGKVIERDITLCALSELVKGSWSQHIGHKVLALFTAWITNGGTDMVTSLMYTEVCRRIEDDLASGDGVIHARINLASSAVWSWVRESSFLQGRSINSTHVINMVRAVSKSTIVGGTPIGVFNMLPVPYETLNDFRGNIDYEIFIRDCPGIIGMAVNNTDNQVGFQRTEVTDDLW